MEMITDSAHIGASVLAFWLFGSRCVEISQLSHAFCILEEIFPECFPDR